MSSSRTHRILLCEKIAADCDALIVQAGEVNTLIRERHLPVTPVNLAPILETKQAAERALRDLELEAVNS